MQTDSKVVLFEQTPIPKAGRSVSCSNCTELAGYGNLQPR